MVLGLVFGFYYLTKKPPVLPPATLNIWGVDNAAAMNDLVAAYKALRPNVTAVYTQVDPAVYDQKILQAFAAGSGPDVLEIPNHSLNRWQPALAPLPTSSAQFNVALMQQYFPTAVAEDFATPDGRVYGLPLSVDTLAMLYNKDYFDAAGIPLAPATWEDFDADVVKLRQVDAKGQIVRAAAAIGGTRASYANANDMVSLLMLQNGTQMIANDHKSATFANGPSGAAAVNFYLQFSDSGSPYYTWNDAMGDALQAFAQGKSAIYFGYASELPAIRAKAPFLNVGIAAMPQPSGGTAVVNYPKYYGLADTKTGNQGYAWDFILYSAAYTTGENLYLKDTNAPAAQRVAIASQQTDPNLAVFAKQALSARSWYQIDDVQVNGIFDTMLKSIASGAQTVPGALESAQEAVTTLMRG